MGATPVGGPVGSHGRLFGSCTAELRGCPVLEAVDVGTQSIGSYESSAGADAVAVLRELAQPLRGCRVLHISATPYGGGVAEILRSEIPLLRDLGLVADWKLISGDDTSSGHQGDPQRPPRRRRGLSSARRAALPGAVGAQRARARRALRPDHRPRSTAARALGAARTRREPLDLALPHRHLRTQPGGLGVPPPFLVRYDAAVFTLGGFVPPDFPVGAHRDHSTGDRSRRAPRTWSSAPSSPPECSSGSASKPPVRSITQVSRFDPWKDPLGVIAAYRLVREEIPDLQLALVGSMALDDPAGLGRLPPDPGRELATTPASTCSPTSPVSATSRSTPSSVSPGRDPEVHP